MRCKNTIFKKSIYKAKELFYSFYLKVETFFIDLEEKETYNTTKKRNLKLDELRLVGKKKVIGYLSVSTLTACGKTMDEMIDYAKENQLQYLFIKNEGNACYRGHLYFYHEKTLSNILIREQSILKKAHIPSHSTEQFITYIGNHHVKEEKYPQAYRLIGKLFNDKRFKKIKKLK